MRGCPVPPSFGGVGVFVSDDHNIRVSPKKAHPQHRAPRHPAPISAKHPTRSNVSRVTDPPLPEHLTSPHALGTRPLPAIQVSPLHHLHLLPAATLPRHSPREECFRTLSRTDPAGGPGNPSPKRKSI